MLERPRSKHRAKRPRPVGGPGDRGETSEFKGRIALGVGIAVLVAIGLAAAAVELSPSASQTSSTTPGSPATITTTSESSASTPTSSSSSTSSSVASSTTGTGSTSSRPTGASFLNLTVTSRSGLELNLDLNSTLIGQGGAVGAQVYLINTLDTNLSLTPDSANSTTIRDWASYDHFCDGYGQIPELGYALFQGDYAQGNLSQAGSPMRLAPFVELPCAMWTNPTSVTFFPHNDTAEVYGTGGATGEVVSMMVPVTSESCYPNSLGGTVCGSSTAGLYGYWSTSAPLTMQQASTASPYFMRFSPGWYTLVAEDVWGQVLVAHFEVAAQGPTTTTTITSSTATMTTVTATSVPSSSSSFSSSMWANLVYMSANPGCSVGSGSTYYPAPCFSPSDGYVFDCASAAATAQGCTRTIYVTGEPDQNFTVTVWFPYTNPASGMQPPQNCKWTQSVPAPVGSQTYYAYCIPFGSSSFLISIPAPAPA